MRRRIMRGKTIGIVIYLLASSFLCIGQTAPLQVTRDHTFTTDVNDYDALQINPSNIAAHWRNDKRVSFGLLSTNMLVYSRGLKGNLLHGGDMSRLNNAGYLMNDIFTERNAFSMDNTLFGININTKLHGCFAFSVRNNVYLDAQVKGALAELDFTGVDFNNIGDFMAQAVEDNPAMFDNPERSYVRFNMMNEFNLGYSRKLINERKIKVFGGVGVKYILGVADMGLEFNGQEIAGYYALSSILPEDFANENYLQGRSDGKKYGHGFGTSIGGSLKMDKFRAGLSVVDVGFMKWPSTHLYITQSDVIKEAIRTQDAEEVVNNVLANSRRNENGIELLPTRMVLGTSYDIHRYVSFYMDVVAPVVQTTRSMTNPTIGLGTWLSLKDYVVLKTGATLVTKQLVTVPVFISLFGGKNKGFEFGVGTTDMLSFFIANREYINFQMAMMKFHF